MFKGLKDFKRRSVQTLLESVGNAEITVDEEYDVHVKKFHIMLQQMTECNTLLNNFVQHQNTTFSDAQEVAKALSRIYEANAHMQSHAAWPNVTNQLQFKEMADANKVKWELLQDTYRSSVQAVLVEQAQERLKTTVSTVGPEIDAECKVRNAHLVDFDSYRRRIKAISQKQDSLVQGGKAEKDGVQTPAMVEMVKEKEKIQHKLDTSEELYNHHNMKSKQDIIDAKRNHDEVVDSVFVTTLVCQAELFMQVAEQMQEVVASLPNQEMVAQVQRRIADFVQQGGVKATPKKDGFKFGFGGAKPKTKAEGQDGTEETDDAPLPSPTNTSHATAPPTPSETPSPDHLPVAQQVPPQPPHGFSDNPFGSTSGDTEQNETVNTPTGGGEPPTPPPSSGANAQPPPPASNAGPDVLLVEALYDHTADDEDELNFKVGDMVEVLEMPDGGWWKGRCHGEEGLFPVNYVKVPPFQVPPS